jgi:hypothetical protein
MWMKNIGSNLKQVLNKTKGSGYITSLSSLPFLISHPEFMRQVHQQRNSTPSLAFALIETRYVRR